jgi:hypothetical protein
MMFCNSFLWSCSRPFSGWDCSKKKQANDLLRLLTGAAGSAGLREEWTPKETWLS